MAGNKKWDKEKHVTVRTMSSGEITAVIENQAEDLARDFAFDSDSGEPINITVSGTGITLRIFKITWKPLMAQ